MRLYASKIPVIIDGVISNLIDTNEIEVTDRNEFKQDVESVLKEYLRKNREITERSKDLMEARGLPYSELFRIKRQMAEEQDFGLGDESVTWIVNQMLELFMASNFVEEVFADDSTIRRKLREVLRRHMQADADLDREVRKHLKNLSEGTESFEIEYQRKLDAIRRKHGLND